MSQRVEFPSHAYVPGKTERHPEDRFDPIRATVQPGQTVDELAASEAFRVGSIYRENGYFWEAHEVLEPVWMACPPGSDARALVQAMIQLANAQLKQVMGKPNAVRRLCVIASGHLAEVRSERIMGFDVADLQDEIEAIAIENDAL